MDGGKRSDHKGDTLRETAPEVNEKMCNEWGVVGGRSPLPSGSLSLLYNHRIRELHRLGLKKVQRFNVFQIRYNRVLGFNHIASSGSSQHRLNVTRVVRKIYARTALSYQSIAW